MNINHQKCLVSRFCSQAYLFITREPSWSDYSGHSHFLHNTKLKGLRKLNIFGGDGWIVFSQLLQLGIIYHLDQGFLYMMPMNYYVKQHKTNILTQNFALLFNFCAKRVRQNTLQQYQNLRKQNRNIWDYKI